METVEDQLAVEDHAQALRVAAVGPQAQVAVVGQVAVVEAAQQAPFAPRQAGGWPDAGQRPLPAPVAARWLVL